MQMTLVYYSEDSETHLGNKGNEALSKMNDSKPGRLKTTYWTTQNQLKINISKTRTILFRLWNKNVQLAPLTRNKEGVELLPSIKALGVYLNEHMTWDDHINYLISKLSSTIGLMRHVSFDCTISINVFLYNALYVPIPNYGLLV